MRIIFFGLGKIGRRHAKILIENFNHELFAFRSGKGNKNTQFDKSLIKEVYSWKDIEEIKPEVGFITNPTFLHIDTALKCAKLNMNLFIEKPLCSSSENLIELIKEIKNRKLSTYVAYNLRFHPIIVYLKKYLKRKKIYFARITCSSFLPNWRGGVNSKQFYSANKKQGGGAILDLSHEFDYINYIFGTIKKIKGRFGRLSDVTNDAEDFVDALIQTENTFVNLHLNFFSRHNERTIKIDCENEYIEANLLENRIVFLNGKKKLIRKFRNGIEDTYKDQFFYFFNHIKNKKMMNNVSEASLLFKKILKFKMETK